MGSAKQRKERKQRKLTTRRLSYAFVLLMSFLWVFFFGGTVTYTLSALCFVLPVLSVGQLLLVRRRLIIKRTLDAAVIEKNQEVPYTVRLRNTSRLLILPALSAEFHRPEPGEKALTRSALHLLPGRGVKLSQTLVFPYRGLYSLPPPRVRVSDLLGLCWMGLPQTYPPLTVTVYPRVHELSSCRVFWGNLASLPRQAISDTRDETTLSSDSRAYQYGDPVNRIHWKLTAQKNDLIVRKYESEDDCELLFLLDTTPPSLTTAALEIADRLVESALALFFYCLRSNCTVRLVHGLADKGVYMSWQKDRASFDMLLDHLAAQPFDGAVSMGALVKNILDSSDQFAGVVVFTSHHTEEILTAMTELNRPTCPAAMVYAAPDNVQIQPNGPPFEMYVIRPGDDIKTALEIGVDP